MNKLSISLAFAAIAVLVLACSEDKEPTHKELCAKTPLKKECLVGSWSFEGVYRTADDKSLNCPEPGYLEFRANGDYTFTGGVWNSDIIGTWTLDGSSITVTNNTYDPPIKNGTITVSNSGGNITVTTTDSRSVFAHCDTDKIEKFRWQGN
ncbi:MAG: lipocalin family protein [Candidatus Fibromonas sp.]|nr:lipocalin family protein [Candidatus Fibromonas sp.]